MPLQEKINRLKNLMYVRPEHPAIDFLEVDFSSAVDELVNKRKGKLFLNLYSSEEIIELFNEMGITEKILDIGFSNLEIVISGDSPFDHRLRLYSKESKEQSEKNLLMELVVKEGIFEPKKIFVEEFRVRSPRMLMIEWLGFQNPKAKFDEKRPRLPGQKFPGLGILMELEAVLARICKRIGYEGVIDVPEYYHGALMYSPKFFFYDPQMQGMLGAMIRDFANIPLDRASTAVLLRCVKNKATGEFVEWSPGEQIMPVSEKMKKYFKSDGYHELMLKAMSENSFVIDSEKLKKELSSEANKYVI